VTDFSQQDIEHATGRAFNRSMSNRREWRFGRKGAFSVNLDDAVWFDHETGEGGTVSALLGRRVEYSAPSPKPASARKRWSAQAAKLWEGGK
jgi:hypothetical protein